MGVIEQFIALVLVVLALHDVPGVVVLGLVERLDLVGRPSVADVLPVFDLSAIRVVLVPVEEVAPIGSHDLRVPITGDEAVAVLLDTDDPVILILVHHPVLDQRHTILFVVGVDRVGDHLILEVERRAPVRAVVLGEDSDTVFVRQLVACSRVPPCVAMRRPDEGEAFEGDVAVLVRVNHIDRAVLVFVDALELIVRGQFFGSAIQAVDRSLAGVEGVGSSHAELGVVEEGGERVIEHHRCELRLV